MNVTELRFMFLTDLGRVRFLQIAQTMLDAIEGEELTLDSFSIQQREKKIDEAAANRLLMQTLLENAEKLNCSNKELAKTLGLSPEHFNRVKHERLPMSKAVRARILKYLEDHPA
jgi:hypothetical protein